MEKPEKSKKLEDGATVIGDSKGNAWEGTHDDPGHIRNQRAQIEKEADILEQNGTLLRKHRHDFITGRLFEWPQEALEKLVEISPDDVLASTALREKKEKTKREALREKLRKIGGTEAAKENARKAMEEINKKKDT